MRARVTGNRWNRDPAGEEGRGYASNGESAFTRAAASGARIKRTDENETIRIWANTNPDEKVRRMQVQIGRVEGRLHFVRDPQERAKLEKQLRIKQALLIEMGREKNDPNYKRKKVRV